MAIKVIHHLVERALRRTLAARTSRSSISSDMTLQLPTFADVLQARRQIAPYLRPTLLYNYPALSELVGCNLWVKHENHLPTCAFKVRGGVNLCSQLSEDERRRGVIAASTGNHGQSVAYGAQLFGVKARICVPEGANPAKVESMRNLGAEIIVHGRDFDEAREHCEALAAQHNYRYVHSGRRAACSLPALPPPLWKCWRCSRTLKSFVVPVGGGSGAAGACIVAKTVNPKIEIIGVQSEAAPAAYRSWKARQLLEDQMNTWAEGLQTRTAFALPQQILWNHLDDFILVSDDEIRAATRLMIEKTRNLVEGASAAGMAASSEDQRPSGRQARCTGVQWWESEFEAATRDSALERIEQHVSMRAVKPPSLATHLESEGEPALALILDWRLGLNWVVNLQQRLAICAFELDAGTIARPHQTLELKSHTGDCGLAFQAHQLGRQPAVRSPAVCSWSRLRNGSRSKVTRVCRPSFNSMNCPSFVQSSS